MIMRGEIVRWSASCAVVLVCYTAAATAIFSWQPTYETPTAPMTVSLMELAPLPTPLPPVVRPPEPKPEPIPEKLPEPPPEVKVEVPLPPVRKPPPPPPKVKPVETPPPPMPAPVATQVADIPPAPSPAPPVAARVHPSPNALALYMARLVAHVQGNLRYPRAAQTRSEQGIAYVLIDVDRSGRVLSHRLDHGSNRRLLDDEAIAVIARSNPLPRFPSDIDESHLELRLPVQFKLK